MGGILESMGLQWGEMGENNLSDFFVCSCFVNVFNGIFGYIIIPKWLIKVPGPIAILFE